MNKFVFGKTMQNLRKHRDIKLVTTDKRRNQLASEPNYYTTKYFPENLIAIEMKKKTKVKMNKPIFLGMSTLDISKTLIYEFWYDYIKSKYQDKAKLCYMDTDRFVNHIKTEDFYENIASDVEKWFNTYNYDKDDKRLFPIGNNEKKGLFKDELEGKIMKEFVGLSAKTYPCLMDDDTEHKKAKGTKKCIIKRGLLFKNYIDCLFIDKIILKSLQRFKSDCHNVYTEQINKQLQ